MKPLTRALAALIAPRSRDQLPKPASAQPSNSLDTGQRRVPKTFSALRHRNFQLYIGGQLVSLAGTWMQIVAQGWLVYQLTGSELALGVVGFAGALPALIVSPWAGVAADRVSKRKLLLLTQTVSMILAFVLAVLTLTGSVAVWHVVVLAVILGAINALDGPTRQAFVVEMVGRADLPNAIAINSMNFNAARVFGPAIGGLLLATVGAGWCFAFNGLSFLAVIASLFMMQIERRIVAKALQSPWQQLKGGMVYAARQPELRGLLLMALSFSTFGIAYNILLPAFVDQALNAGPAAFGLITAALGIGALASALLIATYGDRGRRGHWLFTASMLFPFVLTAFAYSRSLPVALVLALLLGMGFMVQFTLINTLLQTHVEDDMRGRVLGLYTLTFLGFTPFGNLALGALAESIGLSLAMTLAAAVTLITAIAIFWSTPQLRRLA